MADPTPLSDDELVSAYIDGELTDDERARVEADPRLVAILHELTPVVTAVRAPVDLPGPDVMDGLISRALEADTSPAATTDDPTPTEPIAPVVDLAQRRARRNQILSRAGAVAAGIAVVALAGVTIQGWGGSDSDDAGSAADDSGAEELAILESGDDESRSVDADTMTGGADSDDAAESAVSANEGDADEGEAEAPAAEDAEGLFPDAPPSVPGLATDLGPTDQPALEALVDDNLALLSGTPPIEPRPRCSDAGLVAAGFEVVWWAEAEWEGAPAHVVAWRSSTEFLVTVYEGSGTAPDVIEECEALVTFAR